MGRKKQEQQKHTMTDLFRIEKAVILRTAVIQSEYVSLSDYVVMNSDGEFVVGTKYKRNNERYARNYYGSSEESKFAFRYLKHFKPYLKTLTHRRMCDIFTEYMNQKVERRDRKKIPYSPIEYGWLKSSERTQPRYKCLIGYPRLFPLDTDKYNALAKRVIQRKTFEYMNHICLPELDNNVGHRFGTATHYRRCSVLLCRNEIGKAVLRVFTH